MKKAHSRLDESVRDLAMILAVMGKECEQDEEGPQQTRRVSTRPSHDFGCDGEGCGATPTAHLWGLSTVGAFSRKTNNLGAKQTK